MNGTQSVDLVNHPPHYTQHPSGVECIVITEHMGFNVGNAIKYLWRADAKGSPITDLEKARWYVDREIARRKAMTTRRTSSDEPPSLNDAGRADSARVDPPRNRTPPDHP